MELQTLADLFDDPYSDDELDENIALGLALGPDTRIYPNERAFMRRVRLQEAQLRQQYPELDDKTLFCS